ARRREGPTRRAVSRVCRNPVRGRRSRAPAPGCVSPRGRAPRAARRAASSSCWQASRMREERILIGERELTITRPEDPESLIDEARFEEDEFLPYWADLWPSGVALARRVAGLDLAGARVLELGCGLALPSFAAAIA